MGRSVNVIEIARYSARFEDRWNEFVARSKNGTFLFDRRFMDYHSDRFEDHSLVAFEAGRMVALLPANLSSGRLVSHGGLTYGGFVTDAKMRADRMLALFDATRSYMRGNGVSSVIYKPVPHFYHELPAEEDLYALFRCGAVQTRVDVASVIPIASRQPFSKSKKQGVRAAQKAGLQVRESKDWTACWSMLEAILRDRHQTRPTHSLAEIEALAASFSDRIRIFGAFSGDEMVSALVIFDCGRVIHVQYIASGSAGRDSGGVDLIVDHLLNNAYSDRAWLDFGISTEHAGKYLNTGLSRQKEMFGARSVIYQQFEIAIRSSGRQHLSDLLSPTGNLDR